MMCWTTSTSRTSRWKMRCCRGTGSRSLSNSRRTQKMSQSQSKMVEKAIIRTTLSAITGQVSLISGQRKSSPHKTYNLSCRRVIHAHSRVQSRLTTYPSQQIELRHRNLKWRLKRFSMTSIRRCCQSIRRSTSSSKTSQTWSTTSKRCKVTCAATTSVMTKSHPSITSWTRECRRRLQLSRTPRTVPKTRQQWISKRKIWWFIQLMAQTRTIRSTPQLPIFLWLSAATNRLTKVCSLLVASKRIQFTTTSKWFKSRALISIMQNWPLWWPTNPTILQVHRTLLRPLGLRLALNAHSWRLLTNARSRNLSRSRANSCTKRKRTPWSSKKAASSVSSLPLNSS